MAVFVAGTRNVPVEPEAGSLADVNGIAYSWAALHAEALSSARIAEGCGDHVFCPASETTRARLGVKRVSALGIPDDIHPRPAPGEDDSSRACVRTRTRLRRLATGVGSRTEASAARNRDRKRSRR